jgi:hypothetical protein
VTEGWKHLVHDPSAVIAYVKAHTTDLRNAQSHPIFAELGNAHPSEWSLLEAIRLAVSDGKLRFGAYLHLVPALAHANGASASELLNLLKHLRTFDSGYMWITQEPLTSLFRQTGLGRATLQLAISDPDTFIGDVDLLADLVCRAEAGDGLPFFESLPAESNAAARTALLRGIWTLNDSAALPISPALAERLWPLSLAAKDVVETEFLGWGIACRLVSVHDEAIELITQASQNGPQVAHSAIAQWVRVRPAERWPDESRLMLVRNMLSAAMSESSSRPIVDQLIALLLYTPAAQGSMLQLCEDIFSKTVPTNPASDFPNVLSALHSDRRLYSVALTRLLLSSATSLPSLQDLLQHGFQEPEAFVPDAALMYSATPEQRVRAVHRILAEAVSGPALCNFTYRLGEADELQPWGGDAFLRVFIDHIAHEFPQSALEFLRAKKESLAPENRIRSLVTEALEPIERWRSVLMDLPILPELAPSEEKRAALHRRAVRENRRMQKEARAQSIFAKLTTPLNVSQGSRVVSRSPNRPPVVIELKTLSHSFEWPGSDVSDPLARLTRRMKYAQDGE